MKKTSKLLAFIIVFAMIASCVVLPINVSAASTNLIVNGDFESGKVESPWKLNNAETHYVNSAAAHAGSYGIEVNPKADCKVQNQVLRYENISVNSGEWYYLSAWLKRKEAPADGATAEKAFVRLQKQDNSSTAVIAWDSTSQKQLSNTEWTQLQGVAKVTTGGTVFMTAQLNTSSNNGELAYPFYADDYEMIKIAPQATTNLPVSGTIKVDGPQALNLNVSKAAIDGGTVSAVEYNTTDNTWDITYSGLTAGSTYSLVLKTEGMSTVANYPTFAITTAAAAAPPSDNLLADSDVDYSFESMAVGAYSGDKGENGKTSNETYTIVSSADAKDGSKMLKIEGAVDEVATMQRFNGSNRTGLQNILELGEKYEVSVWVKAADTTQTQAPVNVYVAPWGSSKYQPQTATMVKSSVTPNGEWQKATLTFTAEVRNESNTSNGFHIGVTRSADCEADIYVDNYSVKQITPEFTLTADLENGATNVSTDKNIALTFSNAPESFTTSNVELKKGTTTVTEGITVTPVDTKNFTLSLTGLDGGAEYTLKIKDVEDKYDQTAEITITFTTAIPIISADANLLEGTTIDYSFESMAVGAYSGNKGESGKTPNETYTIVESETDAQDGKRFLKIEGAVDEVATMQRFNQVSDLLEKDAEYEVSAWVKAVDPTETHVPVEVYVAPWGQSKLEPKNVTKVSVTPDGTWQKITAKFTAGIRNESNTSNGFHIGVTRAAGCEADIYVDNYSVKRIVPAFAVTATPENGTSNLDLDTEILLSFNNKPYNLSEATVALKKGTTPVETGIDLVKVDDLNYKVALSGLAIGTTYTLDLAAVIDVYGQTLTSNSLTFTTTKAPNLLDNGTIDFSFENGQTSFLRTDPENSGSFRVIDASDVLLKAPHGEKILEVSGRTANSRVRIMNVGGGTENCVEAGKKYIVSFSIRTARDAEGNDTTDKADVYICNTMVDTNTVKPVKNQLSANTDISSGKWTQLSFIVELTENNYTRDPANAGFHIGATIAGNSTVYLDNFILKEYIPEFSVTTNPEDGADSHGSSTVTYTFTNAPVSFTTANVSITGGTATVDAVSKVSDTVYAVTFGGFDYATEYTVSISGVKDGYDQTISKEITFTTGAGNPAQDNNILSAGSTDYSFERTYAEGKFPGAKHSTTVDGQTVYAGETFTVVNAAEEGIEAYDGVQVLKLEAPSAADGMTTSHRFNGIKEGIEIDKQYQISYYARTVNPGETVSASVMTSRSMVSSNNITIEVVSSSKATVTNEWTKVSAVIKVIENPDRTQTAVPAGFHMGVNIDGTSVYIDNYEIFEIPEEELHIVSSTPGDDSTGVQIGVGKLILNYSTPLSSGFNPEASGVIKLYKGETDVTQELVTNVAPGFGNGSIEITVGELENGTQYKVVATGVEDYLGRTASGEIVFTTANAITASDSVVKDGSGNPLDITQVTYDQVSSASITFANTSSSPIDMPLYIYTVYDAAGHLVKTGTTSFSGQIAADGNNTTLTHNFDGIDFENKILILYLVNSFKSLQLASEPVVLDFTNPVQP